MVTNVASEMDLDALWRPFTQHALKQRPLMIAEGHGSTVIDTEGKEYIDAMAGLWCVNVGYGQERLVEAAATQMRRLAYSPLTRPAPPALEFAARLKDVMPGTLNHVVFVNSGSEAVETALKIARQCARQRYPTQNRHKIIARYRGYHGWTMGALSATGQRVRKTAFEPLVPGALHVRPPEMFRLFAGMTPEEATDALIAEIEQVIEFEGPETIAAFIGEPIIGGGGVIVPPDGYWPRVRAVCDKYGILLIHDEVICGFGRTGMMFGSEHWGVVPDIMTVAKGISSAYVPLAATAVTDAVFATFLGDPTANVQFNQLSTYGGHPVACAVGLENLAIIQEWGLVANAEAMGARLQVGLAGLVGRHASVGNVRGKGLLWGIELTEPGTTEPLPAAQVNRVIAAAQERGVLIGKNSATVPRLECTLTLSPPLVITPEEIDRIVAALDGALSEIG